MLMNLISDMCLEITLLKLLPYLPGDSELRPLWEKVFW